MKKINKYVLKECLTLMLISVSSRNVAKTLKQRACCINKHFYDRHEFLCDIYTIHR